MNHPPTDIENTEAHIPRRHQTSAALRINKHELYQFMMGKKKKWFATLRKKKYHCQKLTVNVVIEWFPHSEI